MANIGAGVNSGTSTIAFDTSFVLQGAIYFAPFYQPDTFNYMKDRNLDRQENACGGEDVADNGSKNRDFHISGKMLGTEVAAYHSVGDCNKPVQLLTPAWAGEVRVDKAEFEGPVGYDPINRDFLWQYTLDLVSTGTDEVTGPPDYGIVA